MTNILAFIEKENYTTKLSSTSGNVLIADEPIEIGGQNKGFSPGELLASSLASCTAITLKMYINRKQWQIENIKIDVSINYDKQQNITTIQCKITLPQNITEEQKNRLIHIAHQCPIHKILVNPIQINVVSN